MITMKKLNIVLKVETEEKAAKLAAQGFERVQGGAEEPPDRPATTKDLAAAAEAIHAQISETFQKMGEAMYERLYSALTAALEKPKATKNTKKEGQDGGADQQDSGNSQK